MESIFFSKILRSTLTDSLVAKAGITMERHTEIYEKADKQEDEKVIGFTSKCTQVSKCMYYEYSIFNTTPKDEYLINLIDSSGYVDFSSEGSAVLRVTDWALVVVDSVAGVCGQTYTMLRQSLLAKIKLVLMVNKVDRLIVELNRDSESI